MKKVFPYSAHNAQLLSAKIMQAQNAPLGVRAGKAAGIFTIAVNTGPLPDSELAAEGADLILPNMAALLK